MCIAKMTMKSKNGLVNYHETLNKENFLYVTITKMTLKRKNGLLNYQEILNTESKFLYVT